MPPSDAGLTTVSSDLGISGNLELLRGGGTWTLGWQMEASWDLPFLDVRSVTFTELAYQI